MKRLLFSVVVAFVLAFSGGIALAQFDYTYFHWWTDNGWMLVYECGIWSEPWTVTPGSDEKIAAVLSKKRADGRMDYCFVSLQPRSDWPVKP